MATRQKAQQLHPAPAGCAQHEKASWLPDIPVAFVQEAPGGFVGVVIVTFIVAAAAPEGTPHLPMRFTVRVPKFVNTGGFVFLVSRNRHGGIA